MEEGVARALAEARALGFLGPGPLDVHQASAEAFVGALGEVHGRALDLGSGGGVPGLLLAAHYTEVRWTLLDVHRRRTSFLARIVAELGWGSRVDVERAAAEQAAHLPDQRAQYDVVVARSFARPAVTAECAAGFLRRGGRLAVAEPPESQPDRWPPDGSRSLGLRLEAVGKVAVLRQASPASPGVPRRWKVMAAHPRW